MDQIATRSRVAVAFWTVVATGWLGFAAVAVVGPWLVTAMYDGRSIGPLNSLIQGQSEHEVGVYIDALHTLLAAVLVQLLLVTTGGWVLEIVRGLRTRWLSPGTGFAALVATTGVLLVFSSMLDSPALGQIGAASGLLLVAAAITARTGRDPVAPVKVAFAGLVFAVIFFVSGETILRLAFPSGESFRVHYGPMVDRFERDFVFNSYDGPSRGPEITGIRNPREVRVLLQGDSITWGMGVRDERDLFSNRLKASLSDAGYDVELAVLATPGREIDGHLAQLEKWGEEIEPDVIVYQWYANDVELDKETRPRGSGRMWREFFAHDFLVRNSFLWFFLDFSLDGLLPGSGNQSYPDYMAETYQPGSAGWYAFEAVFEDWLREARGLTPRILVAAYPHMDDEGGRTIEGVFENFAALCRTHGVELLDLWDTLRPLAQEDPAQIKVSVYDGHPNELAHQRVAEALHRHLSASEAFTQPGVIRP